MSNSTSYSLRRRPTGALPGPQGAPGGGGTGAQGSQGAAGSQGFQGSQGSQGFQGAQGAQGFQGTVGAQGFQGAVGSQGVQGSQGFQGNQGNQGATGAQGNQGSQGSQGNQGSQGSQGNTSDYPGLVVPPFPIGTALTTGTRTANLIYLIRVVMPKTGTLHDLAIWAVSSAGTVAGMIYDTGDASAGNYSKLWSTSVSMAGSSAWQVIGDPALPVTQGQQLLLGVQLSSAAATVGVPSGTLANGTLPTSFVPAPGGALPMILGTFAPGSYVQPATISQASVTGPTGAFLAIARVA